MADGPWEGRRRVLAAAMVLVGAVAILAPQLMAVALGHGVLSEAAENGIDRGLARNSATFLSLSGMKALLATVEGSGVGVGFQLEVGDLVQPAYDAVDFVWRAFLASLAVLGLYKLLIEAGILGAGFSVLGVGLVLWGVAALGLERDGRVQGVGVRIAALGLVLAYLLPLSLLATQLVAGHYLRPVQDRAATRIEAAQAPVEEAGRRLGRLREHVSLLEPGRSLEAVQGEARAVAAQISDAVWEHVEGFLSYALVLLVELLLLPFLSAWLILRGVRYAVRCVEPARGQP